MITFFIPFYNEEIRKNLQPFLLDLSKFISMKNNSNNNFILVNDGSSDKTQELIEKFIKKLKKKNKKKVFFITNKKNMGVGYSFRRALGICRTNYIMPLPADNDLPMLDFKKYLKKNIDFVMFYKANMEIYSRHRFVLTMLFRMIYGYFFNIQVNYIQSPCLYKCNVVKKINILADRMSFWPELNIKMLKSNIKYTEVPMIFRNKSYVDRTVSIKNFIEVVYRFFITLFDIHLLNYKKYKFKAKKIYF